MILLQHGMQHKRGLEIDNFFLEETSWYKAHEHMYDWLVLCAVPMREEPRKRIMFDTFKRPNQQHQHKLPNLDLLTACV
jgi:hypothetical protein